LPEWVVEGIIDMFCRLGSQRAIRFRLRPAVRDPVDEFLLELAAASQAGFLVTYNLRDFRGCEVYGVKLVTPGEFFEDNRSMAMNRTIFLRKKIVHEAELAAQEQVSVEEFVSTGLLEQFAGARYLRRRGERTSVERFRGALDCERQRSR
jgi:hypothetical protein